MFLRRITIHFSRTAVTVRLNSIVKMNKFKLLTFATALILLHLPLAANGNTTDSEIIQIKQSIPNLLKWAGSIKKIKITLHKEAASRKTEINDQQTINFISSALKDIILNDQFDIGQQFHQPTMRLEIIFVHKDKEPIHLNWVGRSMFWVTWNDTMRKNYRAINFRSREFERVFFKYSFIHLLENEK